MNLTFKGFLRGYCRELTELETDNLKKLFGAVMSNAPAAAETVMCFAAIQGKADYLAQMAVGTWLEIPYREVALAIAEADSLEEYLKSKDAPSRYSKVWLAYRSKKEAIVADRRVITLMRDKTLEGMAKTQQTAYSLCKQLNLNRGNVYAYLNRGDVTKVSRDTARRLMEAAIA